MKKNNEMISNCFDNVVNKKMKTKLGRNSYCWRFGEHRGDPCGCGWSSKKEIGEFREELIYYQTMFEKETGIKNSDLKNFHYWLIGKILKK